MNSQMSAITVFLLFSSVVHSAVDTLRDTSQIDDAIIYNYADCTSEMQGEDCRRFNGGKVVNFGLGAVGIGSSRRAVMSFPGWNGDMPDSAELLVYCYAEEDNVDRRLFAYSLTSPFIEGAEATFGVGDYPDPDSGVTWNHAWLDHGDADSLLWNNPGGDYTTAIACTTLITQTGQYFSFKSFERILNYWDTSGTNYGIVIVNENAFPVNSAAKTIKSSEAGPTLGPMLLLYRSSESALSHRRRQLISPATR